MIILNFKPKIHTKESEAYILCTCFIYLYINLILKFTQKKVNLYTNFFVYSSTQKNVEDYTFESLYPKCTIFLLKVLNESINKN